jgi:hypothetical protein
MKDFEVPCVNFQSETRMCTQIYATATDGARGWAWVGHGSPIGPTWQNSTSRDVTLRTCSPTRERLNGVCLIILTLLLLCDILATLKTLNAVNPLQQKSMFTVFLVQIITVQLNTPR